MNWTILDLPEWVFIEYDSTSITAILSGKKGLANITFWVLFLFKAVCVVWFGFSVVGVYCKCGAVEGKVAERAFEAGRVPCFA